MEDAAPLFGLAALVLSVSALIHVSMAVWLRWRAAEREAHADRRVADPDAFGAAVREQLARMERALEVQGTELERLGEAQRFTAKLLAERIQATADAAPSARVPGRIVTPH